MFLLYFLSYLNETTESKYKYITTYEDQSLLNQFLPAECIYFRLLPMPSQQHESCTSSSCSSMSSFPINSSISPRSVLASSSRPQPRSQPSRTFMNSGTQECCIPD